MEPAEGRNETEICRRSKLKTNPKQDQNGKRFQADVDFESQNGQKL